jgi:fucose permease
MLRESPSRQDTLTPAQTNSARDHVNSIQTIGAYLLRYGLVLVIRLCLINVALGAVLIWSNLTTLGSFLGLALMGVSLAPIFPSLIATTPARLGEAHTANGVDLQVAAAVLGQSLLPALLGVLARHLGLESVGPALCTASIVLFALYEPLTALPPQRVHLVP